MIANDSSVLIDLPGEDARADAAEACLRLALGRGPMLVCDAVKSEVSGALGRGSEVMDVVEEMGMCYAAIEQRAAIHAGKTQRRYQQRGLVGQSMRTRPRARADLLVNAHAMLQNTGLMTRDTGFFRDHSKGLKLIESGVP